MAPTTPSTRSPLAPAEFFFPELESVPPEDPPVDGVDPEDPPSDGGDEFDEPPPVLPGAVNNLLVTEVHRNSKQNSTVLTIECRLGVARTQATGVGEALCQFTGEVGGPAETGDILAVIEEYIMRPKCICLAGTIPTQNNRWRG
jgi:hypothetical protein